MIKKKALRYILTISYTLSLLPIWGIGLLQIDIASRLTIFLTFIFTSYSVLLFKRDRLEEKAVLLIGPLVYIVATFIVRDIHELLTFPITWIFIIFVIALFFGRLRSIGYNVLIIGSALVYTFLISNKNTGAYEAVKDKKNQIAVNHNLFNFKFINDQLDTVHFSKNNKPFLIETWNETCKPCISSIKDMQEVLSTDTTFNHIYLYQYRGDSQKPIEEIFSFKFIKRKQNIAIDLNNNMFKSLLLRSYPYFLIFDKNGNLVEYYNGYNSKYQSNILEDLLSAIAKTQLELTN